MIYHKTVTLNRPIEEADYSERRMYSLIEDGSRYIEENVSSFIKG